MEFQHGGEILVTPSGLLNFLLQIEELKGVDLGLSEEADRIRVTIGESTYTLEPTAEAEIEVDDEVMEEVKDANDLGYDEFDRIVEEEEAFEDDETVEGGIIKELVKTLAIGGLVRLTKNALMKS